MTEEINQLYLHNPTITKDLFDDKKDLDPVEEDEKEQI